MVVDGLKLDFIADTSKNHSVKEFSILQKKLNALIAILAKWVTKDIMYPVKEELIVRGQKKQQLTLSGFLCVCVIQQFQWFQLKGLAPGRQEREKAVGLQLWSI